MLLTHLAKTAHFCSLMNWFLTSWTLKITSLFPENICWSSRRLQDMSWRRLQHVFSVTIFRLPRRLEDVLKMSCKYVLKTSWRHLTRRLEDVFKTSSRRLQDIFSRRLEDVFKTKKCLLGYIYNRIFENLKVAGLQLKSLLKLYFSTILPIFSTHNFFPVPYSSL